jgi:hypothetical protein
MSCRFYGHNGMFDRLIPSGGNECGLIVDACSRAAWSSVAIHLKRRTVSA